MAAKLSSDVSIQIEDIEYLHASTVNVSDFVSVKFSRGNFRIWQQQMLCLMKSRKMDGMVNDDTNWRRDKSDEIIEKYEVLLKGWILGSLNEEVLHPNLYNLSPIGIWKELENLYGNNNLGNQKEPTKFIELNRDTALEKKEKLYDLALKGSWWSAKSILINHKDAATEVISTNGYTMLDLAIIHGNNYLVEKLLNFIIEGEQLEQLNGCGYTSLHIAAKFGNKDAAKLLVEKWKNLLYIEDKHSHHLPTLIAFTETQVNTFVYLTEVSGAYINISHFNGRVVIAVDLLSKAISTYQYDLAMKLIHKFPERVTSNYEVLTALIRNFPSELGFGEAMIYPSLKNVDIVKRSSLFFNSLEYSYIWAESNLWSMRRSKKYYSRWLMPEIITILLVPIVVLYLLCQLILLLITVMLFPLYVFYFFLWSAFAFAEVPLIKHIEKKKKEYQDAKMITNAIYGDHQYRKPDNNQLKTSILEAARVDAYVVFRLFQSLTNDPMAYITEKGHDIMQVAVINRSSKVYKHIRPLIDARRYNTQLDTSGNNLMHLVAKLPPSVILRCKTGAALQLQRELQWFEELKSYVEHRLLTQSNRNDETPEMVFTREHAELVKEGENWMKTTAESCSITAALIVTIVFAAAITVPGGINQDTGIPLFRKEFVFTVFAVSNGISLFASATSLSVFLSVLTARFAEEDFLVILPRRLFIGLFLLLLSTATMMVAYSTILLLSFCDHKGWMMVPIGALACLPIAAIVFLQFPLMYDLFKSTSFSIFGKEQKGRSLPFKEE